MTKLQDEIARRFLEKLNGSSAVAPEMIEKLRVQMSEKKRLKPENLVKVFSMPTGLDVK